MERKSLEVKLAVNVSRHNNVAKGWGLLQSDTLLGEHPVENSPVRPFSGTWVSC